MQTYITFGKSVLQNVIPVHGGIPGNEGADPGHGQRSLHICARTVLLQRHVKYVRTLEGELDKKERIVEEYVAKGYGGSDDVVE